MLWVRCLLLLGLVRSVTGLSQLRSTVSSELTQVKRSTEVSEMTQKVEMAALREQASKLQKELSQISDTTEAASTLSDSVGLDASVETAFKVPDELEHDAWDPTLVESPPTTPAQPAPQQVASIPALPVKNIEPVLMQHSSHDKVAKKKITVPKVRPNAGKGPENITFGIYARQLYGVGLVENNFVVDLVNSYKWIDPRVSALIPAGLEETTLAKKESEMLMWLPGMVVTNRDLGAYDLVSTAVNINRKGEVHKVERATVRIKNQYILNDYPFDKQNLVVLIASSKYMIDEVVLVPATKMSGVDKDLMKGYSYDYLDHRVGAIRDVDGALKKSRGVLTVAVQRDVSQYQQSHMVPVFLISCISCGIFYFPFVAPFITPRVALSILSLIAFTNLSVLSSKSLPPGSPFNWNDLFNQTVMMMLALNVSMSLFSEVCFHQLKVNDVAIAMNMELKAVMPLTLAMAVGTILSMAGDKSLLNSSGALSIREVSMLVKFLIILVIGSYVAFSVVRANRAMVLKRTQEAEAPKAKAEAPVKLPPPPSAPLTNPNLKASA